MDEKSTVNEIADITFGKQAIKDTERLIELMKLQREAKSFTNKAKNLKDDEIKKHLKEQA